MNEELENIKEKINYNIIKAIIMGNKCGEVKIHLQERVIYKVKQLT